MVIIQGNSPLNNVSVSHYQDHYNSHLTGLFAPHFLLFNSFSHIAVNHRFDHAIPSLRILWSPLTAYRIQTKHPQMSLNVDTIDPNLAFTVSNPTPLLSWLVFSSGLLGISWKPPAAWLTLRQERDCSSRLAFGSFIIGLLLVAQKHDVLLLKNWWATLKILNIIPAKFLKL